MDSHFLDTFSLPQLFLGSMLLMLLFLELGYRIASRPTLKAAKAQVSQVRALMGAALGLTAFLLAFAFAVAQAHYEARMKGMVEEARLARHAYLQADVLNEPWRSEIKTLLHDYISDRVEAHALGREHHIPEIVELIEESEQMQQRLWVLALEAEQGEQASPTLRQTVPEGVPRGYRGYVLALMDIHAERLQAALMNRIGSVIWIVLYLTAALSMLVTGYQAGLATRRSPIATVSLALAFSLVLVLIVDLDRPLMTLFHMDNHVMVDLLEQMNSNSVPGSRQDGRG
jgi:hypothetical protein